MAGSDDGADAVDDLLVVNDAGEIVPADGGAREVGGEVFRNGEVEVDADALRGGMLMRVDADGGPQD